MKIHYNPKLKARAQKLRMNATFAERLLWKYLKGRQLLGYQFSRQKPVGDYIVDFYCSKLKLVIEIDGITHNDKEEYDEKRENNLNSIGLTLLHFDGFYVINHITETVQTIMDKMCELERTTL